MSCSHVRIVIRVAGTGEVRSVVTRWRPFPGRITDPQGRILRQAYHRRQMARRRRNRRR